MLLAAGWLVLAATGVAAPGWQASAQRVAVCAVFGLLAPLFWPGRGSTLSGTLGRIAGWTVLVAGLAFATVVLLVRPAQPLASHLGVCGMLWLVLLLTHASAAALQTSGPGAVGAAVARERAGRSVCLVLALLSALPLWLGPTAERLLPRYSGAVDLVAGLSPLTHLALAAGNDLLRNPWFYQHANLAGLQVNDPGFATLWGGYGAVFVAIGLAVAARRQWRVAGRSATVVDQSSP